MFTLERLLLSALILISPLTTALAQEEKAAASAREGSTVTASATAGRVRFTAPASVVQIRLEVYDTSGRKLFDNELRGGNVLDWHLKDGQAERLADGTYLCVVTVKSLSGKLTQKVGGLVVEAAAARLQAVNKAQLTAQQAEAVGPIGDDSSLTLLPEAEPVATTVMAHDGEEGQVISGKGALTFRLGDFFSGKDKEHMRLTEEGNLGIGVKDPQARLDVAGRIRASEGIVFPDGSIQFSAARKTLGAASLMPGQSAKPGQEHFEAQSVAATQNFLAKFTDNAGTLGNSLIFDNGTNVGIGTTTPQFALDYRGTNSAAAFTRDLGTTPVPVPQSVLQLGISNVASQSIGIGPSFLFFGDNTAGAKSFLGRVSAVWENPTAGAEAGSIFFQVRANSSDTTASTERMRITASGNVGIGTPAPAARLDVAGNINTSTQYNIGGSRVLSVAGRENLFAGVNAGSSNTGGIWNSFFGTYAGNSNTTGSYNSFFGKNSGAYNTVGDSNSFFGRNSGSNNTTGSFNSFFGRHAGESNTAGNYNTTIGARSDVGAGDLVNATALGSNALVGCNNCLVLGSINGINYATADTNVGIGITAPADRLHVAGDVRIAGCVKNGAGTVIFGSCSSDLRMKERITPFPSVIDRLARLRPVHFYWRADQFPAKHFGTAQSYGLIAQEVEEVMPELVRQDESGYKVVNYSKLPLLMLQAVKELKAENDSLRQHNAALEDHNAEQDARLRSLEEKIELLADKSGHRRSAKASTSNSARR